MSILRTIRRFSIPGADGVSERSVFECQWESRHLTASGGLSVRNGAPIYFLSDETPVNKVRGGRYVVFGESVELAEIVGSSTIEALKIGFAAPNLDGSTDKQKTILCKNTEEETVTVIVKYVVFRTHDINGRYLENKLPGPDRFYLPDGEQLSREDDGILRNASTGEIFTIISN